MDKHGHPVFITHDDADANANRDRDDQPDCHIVALHIDRYPDGDSYTVTYSDGHTDTNVVANGFLHIDLTLHGGSVRDPDAHQGAGDRVRGSRAE